MEDKHPPPSNVTPLPDSEEQGERAPDVDLSSAPPPAEQPRKRPRGIYLLPNLITTAALFAGFFSIISSMTGSLENAAIAIALAGFLDALDGRVARMTNTQSEFGVQYDSLSDLVAFGVAPAILMFSWTLSGFGNFGWMIAFLYMACVALRLARFNTQPDSSSFTGLASPGAAGTVATLVWVWMDNVGSVPSIQMAVATAVFTAALALLMVSNITYYSPKSMPLKGRVPFIYLLAGVVLFSVVLIYPPGVLLAIGIVYAVSGPAQWLWRKKQNS